MRAFKPRRTIFLHACMNCEYGKKVTGSGGSALGYICILKEGTQRLFGTHECDVEAENDKDQVNWFDEFKEKKEE